MRKDIVMGIDVGTHKVKVVVAKIEQIGVPPRIIGTGSHTMEGMRHGYIINAEEAQRGIAKAIQYAQEESGLKSLDSTYLSIGGRGLSIKYSNGDAIVSRVNSEVTQTDIDNAIAVSEEKMARELINQKIIQTIPIAYSLDSKEVYGSPVGMHGAKVSVQVMLITIEKQHIEELKDTIENLGVRVLDTIPSPVAESVPILTKQEKIIGSALINIGAETTSLIVYEEGVPIYLKVFSIGSVDITNDLAIALKVPVEEADQIKKGVVTGSILSQKKINTTIHNRIKDIFNGVQEKLKKIDKAGILPGGIIITGGGSETEDIVEYAKTLLKLPTHISGSKLGPHTLKDNTWAAAYGLCLLGSLQSVRNDKISGTISNIYKIIRGVFGKFLP